MGKVFEYIDYRKFLGDFYLDQKNNRRRFSYQKFADQAGFNTKTFLFKVINGEKALSKKSIFNVARAMLLKKRETGYFEAMVNFNDAKTMDQRQYYFERMKDFMRRGETKNIRENQFSYFSKWWNPVIRELVTSRNFRDDWVLLAKSLVPAIRPKQAKDAVKLLLSLGLIKKTGPGAYKRTDAVISTGDEVRSLAVQSFHRDVLKIAHDAVDRFPRHMREISGAVLFVSKPTAEQIKWEIQSFRKKILDLAEKDRGADRVYLTHFQFFPLTKIPKRER